MMLVDASREAKGRGASRTHASAKALDACRCGCEGGLALHSLSARALSKWDKAIHWYSTMTIPKTKSHDSDLYSLRRGRTESLS